MTLREAEISAKHLMAKHGLLKKGWRFKFDNAKSRAGYCQHSNRTIGLSKFLTPHMKDEKVIDTILHEIAHALVDSGHGHNRVWRRKAIEIGCSGERCYSHDDMVDNNKLAVESKYTATCPNCGIKKPMHRKLRRKYSCGDCGNGKYNEKYRLVITQNY